MGRLKQDGAWTFSPWTRSAHFQYLHCSQLSPSLPQFGLSRSTDIYSQSTGLSASHRLMLTTPLVLIKGPRWAEAGAPCPKLLTTWSQSVCCLFPTKPIDSESPASLVGPVVENLPCTARPRRVWDTVWEDFTRRRATEPVHSNYGSSLV